MTRRHRILATVVAAVGLTATALFAQDRFDRNDRRNDRAGERGSDRGGYRAEDRAFSEKYSTIWLYNIFVRDRSRIAQTTNTGPREPRSYRPEQSYALRGIVLVEPSETEGAVYLAFVEDGRAGTTRRVRAGDSIARGKVISVTMDGLEYEVDGRVTHVAIGMNFEGGSQFAMADYASATTLPVSGDSGSFAGGDAEARLRARRAAELSGAPMPPPIPPDQPTQPQDTTPGAAPTSDGPPADALSIEERMRQRRAQETGR